MAARVQPMDQRDFGVGSQILRDLGLRKLKILTNRPKLLKGLAEENIEGHYRVDPDLFHPKPHYLLQVHGMSMRDAGILDGDLVAVHRTPEIRSSQIVVARLEDEVTVKRYRQDGSVVWLLPENADFEPISVDLKESPVVIEGVVVGVVRQN